MAKYGGESKHWQAKLELEAPEKNIYIHIHILLCSALWAKFAIGLGLLLNPLGYKVFLLALTTPKFS